MESRDDFKYTHPNWSALAKVQLPIKRFVGPETTKTEQIIETISKLPPTPVASTSGTAIMQFYENTIKSSSKKPKNLKITEKQLNNNFSPLPDIKIPFDQNRFFRAAMSNDIKTLKSFNYNENNCINTTDMFGWTALMMAACENSIDSFKFLLDNGAKLITTNTGTSAATIAKQKGFIQILVIIKNYENKTTMKNITEAKKKNCKNTFEKFYCNICDMEFQETTVQNHETSTIHQFNMKSERKSSLRFMLSKKNRGLKIMVKQGWNEESGLGPNCNGKLFPIKTVLRKQRSGLGIEQNSAKITHYKPYDLAAIKYHPLPRQKTRKDMQIELRRNQRQEKNLRKELS